MSRYINKENVFETRYNASRSFLISLCGARAEPERGERAERAGEQPRSGVVSWRSEGGIDRQPPIWAALMLTIGLGCSDMMVSELHKAIVSHDTFT